MAYLLDTNVFIEAKNLYYGYSICPGFWHWLDLAHEQGKILSIKRVRDELMGREDWLTEWCRSRSKMFLNPDDQKTYARLELLATWATGSYSDAACAKFLGCADFVLVGYADAYSHTVVTTEIASNGYQIKIPNACKAMDVPCVSPFQMLAKEKTKFYLPT